MSIGLFFWKLTAPARAINSTLAEVIKLKVAMAAFNKTLK